MGRLFGTDGARGVANAELTPELAMNIGRAAAMVLISDEVEHPTILIGKDTRLSGDMLEGALIAGLCSVGANVHILGVVPTPAVAYLVGKYNADAGIMISASHNPFEFNGIKIFSSDGCKLPDALENRIEEIVLDHVVPYASATDENIGRVTYDTEAADLYIDHLVSAVDCDFEGMEIALDCSNGSSSRTAEKLFTKLGAKVHMLFDEPDGVNINRDCGSTHMSKLQKYVREHKLSCGLAFDGDADRCLAVDENGNLVDGDYLIAICANDMKQRGVLKKNAVVGTIMTNMGFNKFCEENDMHFVSTKVGDRYVLEAMIGLCRFFLFCRCSGLGIRIFLFLIIFQDLDNILLLVISDDNIDSIRDVIFSGLHVTATGNDNRIRIHLSCPVQHLSGFPVCHICHRTGIDDIHICTFLKRHNLISMLFQQFLHGFRLIRIHFAPEIMQCYFLHVSVPFFFTHCCNF